jgi:hypothetical protein
MHGGWWLTRNFNAEHFNASALQDTNVSKLTQLDGFLNCPGSTILWDK